MIYWLDTVENRRKEFLRNCRQRQRNTFSKGYDIPPREKGEDWQCQETLELNAEVINLRDMSHRD
jgi:hypothetical protein